MKKGIAAALAFTLLASGFMAGCGSENQTASTSNVSDTVSSTSTPDTNEEAAITDEPASVSYAPISADFDTSGVIEEQVLYDDGKIKLTATSLEYESSRAELFVLVENNTNEEYNVITGSMGYSCNSVNGWMIHDGWFAADVPAGKKSNEHCYFDYDTMIARGIHGIGTLAMGFEIYPEGDYSNNIYTGPIEIKTSLANSVKDDDLSLEQTVGTFIDNSYDLNGKVSYLSNEAFYDNGGITVRPLAFISGEDTATIILEAENASDIQKNIAIDDTSANGFTLCSGRWTSEFVNAGKKDIFDVDFKAMADEDEWESMGINTITDVEFSIQLRDSNYDEISADTPVQIHVSDADASENQIMDSTEETLYSNHDITIINKGVSEDKYGSYMNWNLLIQNDNNFDLYVSDEYDSLSVGDYMIDYIMFSSYIGPHKSAIATVEIQKSSLEDNGIDPEAMGTAEIELELRDSNSYQEIDTPTVSADLTLN